ncbi:MAG: hypothetical protein AMXMBFR47_17650 [Planctomycetota bacterium]
MNRAAMNRLWISAIFLAIPLQADTVKLTGRPAFENVRILDFRAGRLQFRGVSGEVLRKPLSEIEWLAADAAPELSEGERLRARREPAAALDRYRVCARKSDWTGAVALRRQIDCAGSVGKTDVAVDGLFRLLELEPEFEPHLARIGLGEVGSAANGAALKRLRTSNLRGNDRLIGLRLELTILESPDTVGSDFRAPAGADSAGDGAGNGDDRLFARSRVRLGGQYLPCDGHLRTALRALAESGKAGDARVRYEAARPFVAADCAAGWNLLDARLLIDEGRAAEAADRLVTLRTAGGDAEIEAEIAYSLGLAHERLGQTVLAAELYRELAAREQTPETWKRRALTALERAAPATRPANSQATPSP